MVPFGVGAIDEGVVRGYTKGAKAGATVGKGTIVCGLDDDDDEVEEGSDLLVAAPGRCCPCP